jgi:hypothetical protein
MVLCIVLLGVMLGPASFPTHKSADAFLLGGACACVVNAAVLAIYGLSVKTSRVAAALFQTRQSLDTAAVK